MLNKVKELYDGYLWTLTFADKRVGTWLFMSSPTPTFLLTSGYLLMVVVGPRIMRSRTAVNLKEVLFLYNFSMVSLNFYIFYELLSASSALGYSYTCQPVNYSEDFNELRVARALWWYYVSKCIEFMDTLFFILRKKNEQITFLHVYHHSTMFCLWWIGIKWVAGGSAFLGAMANSMVHVLMYTYYGLSSLGPWIRPYLRWKRCLTVIQLVQFAWAIVHAGIALRVGCQFPIWMHWALIFYAFSLMCLFGNFYLHTYIKRNRSKPKDKPREKAETILGSSEISSNGHSRRRVSKQIPNGSTH